MTIARGVRAVAAAWLLLLVAACAQENSGASDGAGAPADPVDAEAVALRVDYTGGYVTPGTLAARLPLVSVYGDGRVITEGPQTLQYPGPALPNLQVQRISAADVDKLVDRAVDAGVGAAGDLGQPQIADATSTRFTVVTAGGTKTTEVYALAEAAADTALTENQRASRAKLQDLLAALTDLPTTLGSAVGAAEPYTPVALAAIAAPWVAADTNLDKQPEVAWPGPALPGDSLGAGLNTGCATVTGDATAKVLTAATKANAITPWTSGGKRWTVHLRPMLPDESGCADIQGK